MMKYKVLEISPVDAETLQARINAALEPGMHLNHVDYIRQEGVKRPHMAFAYLALAGEDTDEEDAGEDNADT